MHHHLKRIEHRPPAPLGTLHADDGDLGAVESLFQFHPQRAQVGLRGPGGQHQVVGDRRLRPHVEHLEILRLFVIENAGHQFEHLE